MMNSKTTQGLKTYKEGAGASRPRPLCVYLEAEVFSKEYLFTIHYLFVISNNILAHGLAFRGDPYSWGGGFPQE